MAEQYELAKKRNNSYLMDVFKDYICHPEDIDTHPVPVQWIDFKNRYQNWFSSFFNSISTSGSSTKPIEFKKFLEKNSDLDRKKIAHIVNGYARLHEKAADSSYISDIETHYTHLKKLNLLLDLQNCGFDVSYYLTNSEDTEQKAICFNHFNKDSTEKMLEQCRKFFDGILDTYSSKQEDVA